MAAGLGPVPILIRVGDVVYQVGTITPDVAMSDDAQVVFMPPPPIRLKLVPDA